MFSNFDPQHSARVSVGGMAEQQNTLKIPPYGREAPSIVEYGTIPVYLPSLEKQKWGGKLWLKQKKLKVLT